MLKSFTSICAALILTTAAFSAPAQARGGAHFGGGGAHLGGARIGGTHFGGAGLTSRGYAYRSAVGPGRYGHYGYRHPGYRYGYRHGAYRYGYYGGLGWGAFASEWPDYYDYGYAYEAPAYDGSVAYCIQRFRSYDPVSRTYRGYDGYPHSCP
jgi:BA14K-like protein